MMIRIVSFNIHKGYNFLNRRYTLDIIRQLLENFSPDIVLLQELHGMHPKSHPREKSPLEDLADKHWPFYSHGVNSVYESGFHGNAVLSRYPIKSWQNIDISTNRLERRGLLECEVQINSDVRLRVFCTHLNLAPPGQVRQAQKVVDLINPQFIQSPLVLAGDFNDWTGVVRRRLTRDGDFEALEKTKTFPSTFPLLSLDGFYFKGLKIHSFQRIDDFRHGSDHLPILVDCQVPSF